MAKLLQESSVLPKHPSAHLSDKEAVKDMSDDDVDMIQEGTVSEDLLMSNNSPSQFVSLWPLFDHLTLLVKGFVLAGALWRSDWDALSVKGGGEQEEEAVLRDFAISHSPWVACCCVDSLAKEHQNMKVLFVYLCVRL